MKKFLKAHGSSYKMRQISMLPAGVFLYTVQNLIYSDKCQSAEDKLMPMEDYLFSSAKKHGTEVVGLETVEDNIETLRKMFNGDSHLLDTIRKIFRDVPAYSRAINDCAEITTYKGLKFNYQLSAPAVSIDSAYEGLLVQRNKKWLPGLHDLLRNKHVLIAVGYKHLYYREGLINLLRSGGYYLFPVKI
jgi:uncharacterized protein YbaP (TraB family)